MENVEALSATARAGDTDGAAMLGQMLDAE